MEIVKTDTRSITLERFSIEREEPEKPVNIRAWLTVETPAQTPSVMRVRVDFENDDIPNPNEQTLGRRIVRLLADPLFD